MKKLALSVNLEQVFEEILCTLATGKSVLLIGQTDCEYAKAVNMKNGSFNGHTMYAGFKNRTLKFIEKIYKKKYKDINIESGKGWLKLSVN